MAARRRKGPAVPAWRIALVAVGAGVLLIGLWLALGRTHSGPERPSGEFGDRVLALAREAGARHGDVEGDLSIRKVDGVFVRRWRVTLPGCQAARRFAGALEAEAPRWGGSVRTEAAKGCPAGRIRVDLGTEAFAIEVRFRKEAKRPTPRPTATPRPRPTPTIPPERHGRLAILLDDAGQSLDLVPRLEKLPPQIAVAVLPFLPASTETAARLHRTGHEVWLHLPMEPEGYPKRNPGPGAVLTSMSEAEIRATVRSALNNVPFVVGVNNHEGSRATANLRVMTWVMQELAGRGIAFLDSRTTKYTVAEDAARAQGVRTGRRNVFLDNVRTPAAVRSQLEHAVYLARRDGSAIAIGHCNPVTVSVLEAEAGRLWKQKVELVPPTKLLH